MQAATSYENKKKQLEEYWGKFYYSEIYNPYVDNRRKEHLLSIQKYINQYANMDLRDPDVVSSFQNLFTNIASDNIVMNGIKVSEQYREEKQFQNYLKVSGIYDEGDPEKKSYAMYDPDLDRMLDIQIEEYSRMSLDDPRLSAYEIDTKLVGVNLDKLISDQLKAYGIDEGAGEVKYYMLDQNGNMAEISETEMSNIMRQTITGYASGDGTFARVTGQNPVVAKVTKGGITQTYDLGNLIYDIYSSNGLVRDYFNKKTKSKVYDRLKAYDFDYAKTMNSLISDFETKSSLLSAKMKKYETIANQADKRALDLSEQIKIAHKLTLNSFNLGSMIKLDDLIKKYEEMKKMGSEYKSQSQKISAILEDLHELKKDYDYVVTPEMFNEFINNRYIKIQSSLEMYLDALDKGLNISMNKLKEQTQVVTSGTSSISGLGGGRGSGSFGLYEDKKSTSLEIFDKDGMHSFVHVYFPENANISGVTIKTLKDKIKNPDNIRAYETDDGEIHTNTIEEAIAKGVLSWKEKNNTNIIFDTDNIQAFDPNDNIVNKELNNKLDAARTALSYTTLGSGYFRFKPFEYNGNKYLAVGYKVNQPTSNVLSKDMAIGSIIIIPYSIGSSDNNQ
jgi:uncharacterized protein YvpB